MISRKVEEIQGDELVRQVDFKALAKINLGLDVLGKRADGYHDVRMVMQSIYLYDNIRIEETSSPGIKLSSNLSYLPTDQRNIAYKAADMLIQEFKITHGVNIHLNKRIPVAAGLAGGSSNAATVLFGMNILFKLGLNKKELMERGLKLGADVPYCIMRGTALAEGIGEKLTPLPPLPRCIVLIAKPSFSVSTKNIYEGLRSSEKLNHPNIDRIISGLEAGSLDEVVKNMGNVLESVTISMHPIIDDIKNLMVENGALGAMMSGSGPTVFGLFTTKAMAAATKEQILNKKLARQVYVTTTQYAQI